MKFIRTALLGLAVLCAVGVHAAGARPNVVLIMTDDQGYGDLGAHGNPWLRTPNLDQLHAESVRFTNFHVDPTCAPTRSALMTGRYSTRTGCWHTIMGRSLIDVLPTLMELCGLKMGPPNPLDGTSLVPLLRGTADAWPARTLFAHVQREEIPPKWVNSAVMTDRWRLIDGKALYNMDVDRGQITDVAARFPDVVTRLRGDYETWWTSLVPSFPKHGSITIGADAENPARLTCHDWHSEQPIPWDQGHIRRDMWVNGYWMIDVAEAGRYEFTLYRQPKQANHPLEATRARVNVDGVEAEAPVAADATSATLQLELKPGQAKLQTWLVNESVNKTRGAFFVHVRRVDDG